MVFGFAAATVAGFLLTAIPNWTGRMPLQGGPLETLFCFGWSEDSGLWLPKIASGLAQMPRWAILTSG